MVNTPEPGDRKTTFVDGKTTSVEFGDATIAEVKFGNEKLRRLEAADWGTT
jgi:hypothetical protein